ncbi:MAG: PepSY domain-containing protein [Proteobacteria bacterium]|nr:PepSY domain-containing protein [Pseudomonadota bacterium]
MNKVKRFATSIHLWVGLTVGLAGCYLAATGGWLLLRPQSDALVSPYLVSARACPAAASFDRAIAAARGAYRGSPVESLWWKADPRSSLMVRYHDDQQAYFDRCDGHLLGVHSRWTGAFGFVEKLHRLRFLPAAIANNVAGAVAIGMAVAMGLIGLFIWWPRRRSAWKAAVSFDPGLTGRPRTRNRHSTIGAFVAPMLLLIAGTGVVIGFDTIQALIGANTAKKLPKLKIAALPAGRPAAMDAAWRNMIALTGEMPLSATLKAPAKSQPAIEIYFNRARDAHREIRNYVYADAATGTIARYTPYDQLPAGQRAYQWILGLHQGAVGGLAGQLLSLAATLAIVYLGYSGVKSYVQKRIGRPRPAVMRIAAVRDEAAGVKSFDLVTLRGGKLPRFNAGAHIDVHVPGGPKRQFSLVNGPAERDRFHIAVRLENQSRGGSRGMHALEAGQELLVGAPRNHFPIARSTRHATLIAAGIGITPILSMARHLAARGKPFTLHYFGRSADEMPFRDVLADRPFAGRTHVHVGVGRASIPGKLGSLLAERPRGGHLYVCGPEGFMDAVEGAALRAGWPQAALHRENFSSLAATGPREAVELTLARSGRKIVVAPEESLLDALVTAGVKVSSSCEQGTCGDCALTVCAGEIDHRDRFLSDAQRARGDVMLACVSRAKKGSLVVDL